MARMTPAQRLANYEHRDEQLTMADAVAAAIKDRHHLVVEAHTLESVAGDHLGLRLTNGQVEFTLRRLYAECRPASRPVRQVQYVRCEIRRLHFPWNDPLIPALIQHHCLRLVVDCQLPICQQERPEQRKSSII